MLDILRTWTLRWKTGLVNGAALGGLLIFLTLIGIPSEESKALANITVPIFIFLAIYSGWRTARQFPENQFRQIGEHLLAMGIMTGILFLLFMRIINNWHADGVNVIGTYFARMDTYPVQVLSGVPEEELFPNPEPNPITGEYEEGARLRTNPMSLYTREDYALVSIGLSTGQILRIDNFSIGPFSTGYFHIGGLYGMALILLVSGITGGITQNLAVRVDWQQLRADTGEQIQSTSFGQYIPAIRHWLTLLLPLILFFIFWISVPQTVSGGVFTDLGIDNTTEFHLFDIDKSLNLTSDSLTDGRSIQLLLTFMVIVSGIFAVMRTQSTAYALPYPVRMGIVTIPILIILGLAIWRITLDNEHFIAPSPETYINIYIKQFDIRFHMLLSEALSILLAVAIATGMLFYAAREMQKPAAFETTLILVLVAGLILISPLYMNQYQNSITGRVALMVMFGLGLNIVVGYAGLLDLGYVAFFAIGAYTFAFLSPDNTQAKIGRDHLNDTGWLLVLGVIVVPIVIFTVSVLWENYQRKQRLTQYDEPEQPEEPYISHMKPLWQNHPPAIMTLLLVIFAIGATYLVKYLLVDKFAVLSVWQFSPFIVGIVVVMTISAFGGILLGIPVLRLRGDYLAIVTLGFGEIVSLSLKNLDDITGGPSGALGIAQPVPKNATNLTSSLAMVYLSFLGILLVVILSSRLRSSRIGRAWLALRSDEDIAQAMGINLVNAKLLAFSTGASFAGLAGMLFATQQGAGIFPQDFTLERSIYVLSLVIIGGMGSIPGVIVGSMALVGLPELLRPVQEYRIMMFGLLLVVTMIVRPEGLMPLPPPAMEEEAKRLAKESKDHLDLNMSVGLERAKTTVEWDEILKKKNVLDDALEEGE